MKEWTDLSINWCIHPFIRQLIDSALTAYSLFVTSGNKQKHNRNRVSQWLTNQRYIVQGSTREKNFPDCPWTHMGNQTCSSWKTEDSNNARNQKYGIGANNDYEDAVSKWIKKYISVFTFKLDKEARQHFKLEFNKKGNSLLPGILNYTNETTMKQIYNIINTLILPTTGELRVRSDINKVPYWKYAKQVYFGLTPYHMHAGVTASNYKYHKRKTYLN